MGGAKNAVYTKEYNRLLILRHLRQQPASRAELARLTGLTRAAISLITEELIDGGFIKESSQSVDHGRGRTPVLLKLHPDGAYAVGICLTRQDCRVGLCDFRGRLLGSRTMPLPKRPQALAEAVGSAVEALVEENAVPREKLLGAGVVTPGPVDAKSGTILNPPGFAAFHGFAICDSLGQRLGLPVLLENDANAAALHNYMDGQFPGKDNFLLLLVDSGVGSGAIVDGKLLPPFVSISGLGESAAWDLMEGREGKHFLSVEEVAAACPKVSKTHIQMLKEAGAFGDLPETSQVSLF